MNHVKLLIILAVFLCVSGCNNKKQSSSISPMLAIELSADSAPETIEGTFELTVKSTDCKQRLEFLNSEVDNRDQRNLIIALRPNAVKELTDLFGISPEHFFLGKRIKVTGEAKRTKEWVYYNNKNIKKYYYQTKVFVRSADQLTIL